MKRKMLEFGMAVVLLFCAYLVSREGAAAITANTSVVKKDNVIVLDAGHGGSDPGKIGINNAKEKEINLQITNKLKDLLEANDYTVVMTRKTDAGLYQDSDSNKKIADMKKRCE
ncbi:MAG TPA: N-acetylmuramoyl-L-alanine amidase, partial [Candidatus Merdenecus merdavium]|nr:N-acetylmuramoyl-L-alanine amidase [Candidatus Merdenecus merdavium]